MSLLSLTHKLVQINGVFTVELEPSAVAFSALRNKALKVIIRPVKRPIDCANFAESEASKEFFRD